MDECKLSEGRALRFVRVPDENAARTAQRPTSKDIIGTMREVPNPVMPFSPSHGGCFSAEGVVTIVRPQRQALCRVVDDSLACRMDAIR